MRAVTVLLTLRVLANIDEGQEVQQVFKESDYRVDHPEGAMTTDILDVVDVVVEDSR